MVNAITRLGLAVLLLGGLPSADAAVTARVNRDTVQITDTVQLLIEQTGTRSAAEPDLSVLGDGFEVVESSQNSQVSIVNGRTTSRIQWVVTLAPTTPGEKIIPAIPVGKERTAPIRLRVLPAKSDTGTANLPALFLEAAAEPLSPYVQAQVTYTVRLYHLGQLQEGSLADPTLQDAIVERLGEDLHYASQRGERRYRVIERRYALFPQSSGTLQIPPITFSGRAVQGARGGASPFGGILQSTQPVRARAPAVVLQVRPRPAQAAAGPWLPAQMLEVTQEWAPDPPVFRVGLPVTRTLTVRARGLSAAQLPEIAVPQQEFVKAYPDQPITSMTAQGVHVIGKRVEKHALVPSRSGTLTLQELRIPWWDTLNDRAQVALVRARTIHVEPAVAAVQPQAPARIPLRLGTNESALSQEAQPTPLVPGLGAHSIWQATSGLLLLAWLLTLGLWWHQRGAGRAISASTDSNLDGNSVSLREALAAFEKACAGNDCRAARQALLRWCDARWPEARPGGIPLLVARLDEPTARGALRQLDTALYGKGTLNWDGAACRTALANALPRLSAPRERKERPSALPGLYPVR